MTATRTATPVASVLRSWLGNTSTATAPSFAASPWSRLDVRRLVVVAAAGWAALVAGWVFASRRAAVDDQLPWLNLAVIGFLAAGMANAAFLLRGYRAVRQRRQWLFALRSPAPAERVLLPVTSEVVASTSMTRYHRPDCPFVAGKDDVRVALSLDEHRAAGRAPCRWCMP